MPFIEKDEMLAGSPLPGWSGRFFHSAQMTFGCWDIAAGAAPCTSTTTYRKRFWNVAEGEIALTVDGLERIVRVGMAVVIPSGTLHSARPIGLCRAIVVDHPLRHELPGLQSVP